MRPLRFVAHSAASSAFAQVSDPAAAAPTHALTPSRIDSKCTDSDVGAVSFEEVYRRHVGFVWRTLRRLGVFPAELEDAVQDVFLILHRRLDEFDPTKASMATWLYGMARGVAANRRRKVARARQHSQQLPAPNALLGPEQHAEYAQAERVVGGFLETLPADRRAVFELCEIEGLRGSEIAAILDVNVNTVHTRIRAVRALFKAYVEQIVPSPEGKVELG